MSQQGYVPAYDFALIYAGLGEKGQALDWLEKAYQSGVVSMGLKMDPTWDGLSTEPRFQDLIRLTGYED
jgi:hypothetical protein